ncbi:MAG: DUF945 family protein, partial [Desulfopila sp.]
MKKILIAVAFLGAAIGFGAPLVNGILMEKTIRGAFDDINGRYSDSGVDYSLEIVEYNRKFFTSDITWKVNFGSLKAVYGMEEIVLRDHAEHGYTGVTSSTSLEQNSWFATFVDNRLQGENPLAITTSYSFLGDIAMTIDFDAFSMVVDKENLTVNSGRYLISTDGELENFTVRGEWQGMRVGDKMVMGRMGLNAEMRMLSSFLWDGAIDFTMDEISITGQQNRFEMLELQAHYTADVDSENNLLSTTSSFSMEKLETPATTIDGAAATFTVRNIDGAAYENFMQLYTRTISKVLTRVAALEDAPEKRQKMLENQMGNIGIQMIGAMENMLTEGLELEIANVLVTLQNKQTSGEIRASISLRLLKDMTLMQFAPVAGQPDLALDILSLNSDISLPA